MNLPFVADGFAQTYRSYVAMWERDENDHWNAMFYVRAFQEASETIALAAVEDNPGAGATTLRHVRFFHELRGGEPLRIESARVSTPDGDRLLHVLRQATSGTLCATALDQPAYQLTALPVASADLAISGPRGLGGSAHEPVSGADLIRYGRALVSQVGVVRPVDLDHGGSLRASAVHARINDGSPHLWNMMNVPLSRLYEQELGRTMVEMKVTRHGNARAGDVLRMVSWIEGLGEKSIEMRHQLEDARTAGAVASVSIVSVMLDLKSRRAVRVPDFLRAGYEAYRSGKSVEERPRS